LRAVRQEGKMRAGESNKKTTSEGLLHTGMMSFQVEAWYGFRICIGGDTHGGVRELRLKLFIILDEILFNFLYY
jgi:hypothetical protein